MKLGFQESQVAYISGAQNARAWTEQWAKDWLYCPNCGGSKLDQFSANRPVADFHCSSCSEEFELKSQKRAFGDKIVDGAYRTMCERLSSLNNPNLMLLKYDISRLEVTDVCVVPKHFFVRGIIEERKPLAPTARRAGWIGCNILLRNIPETGKIFFVKDGVPEPRERVLARWGRTLFLRDEGAVARGWLIEVLRCVEMVGRPDFELSDVYRFEHHLKSIFPNNMNVRPKIRQQLQVLRDEGLLDFRGRGRYRLRTV